MAGLSSVGASLPTTGSLQQTLLMPGSLTQANPLKQHFKTSTAPFVLANVHGAEQALHDHSPECGDSCFKLASVETHAEKSSRLVAAPAQPVVTAGNTIVTPTKDRFERMEAALSPSRIAAAFAGTAKPRATNAAVQPVISTVAPVVEASLTPSNKVLANTVVASLSDDTGDQSYETASLPSAAVAPAAERFARVDSDFVVVQTAPQPMRFGAPAATDTPDPSQLALALVKSMPVDDEAFASPLPIEESSADVAVSTSQTLPQKPGDVASLPDALSDDVPLPTQRPQLDNAPAPKSVQQPPKVVEQPKAVPQTKPMQLAAKPAPQTRQGKPGSGDVLAYARPDTPSGGLGQAFKNLFSGPRGGIGGAGNGVAVYDISAKTVYLPDGQRLEAHSGLGVMVDQPRYVDQKDRGPTPPNTYDLTLRETRFHGVEAIRLTPVGGRAKYNRVGLLAHTYMLSGGRAESNGCVVFKDYGRFLAAFKKGNVTRLVVVPRLNGSLTQVASMARGA
ncbi:DUF2778 domain-containing protein [Mesorhizobium sp. PAMC28654]|uniref:DUF2778 domain-containing protein n=1 Tax=Mesorhizobium sp. PAMC28654 TaxID=2880934 RepID=UPI001D0A1927|nr:DUF2778 domain-containing protein [Mesorhizobium sp. PAMC28654]UDL88784.1 DUF2778 domain-containing protein [Mesorhizobium sp. PAMC28654]